jgi:hypothetical protein
VLVLWQYLLVLWLSCLVLSCLVVALSCIVMCLSCIIVSRLVWSDLLPRLALYWVNMLLVEDEAAGPDTLKPMQVEMS